MYSNKTRLSLANLIAVFLLVAACGGDKAGPADPAVERGKATFDRVCAMCHGFDATGRPGLGKNLHDNAFSKSLSDQELVEFLRVGRPASHELNETRVDMPPKGGDPTITDEDLKAIVAFLRTL